MEGYSTKEYIKFEDSEEDDEEDDDWKKKNKIKYTPLEEDDFDDY